MYFNQIVFKLRILFIAVSTFLLLPILNGQQIKHVGGKIYQYEGQVYEYEKMDHVFRQNEFSYRLFQKTNRKRKTGNILWAVSLVGGLGLYAVGAGTADRSSFAPSSGAIIGGIGALVFVGGVIAAIIVKSGSKKLQRRSVDIYNQQSPDVKNENSTSTRAQLGLLSNGRVGIVFNF